MLDIYSDLTLQCAVFGGHAELIEVDELAALRRAITASQVKRRLAEFRKAFEVQPGCVWPRENRPDHRGADGAG